MDSADDVIEDTHGITARSLGSTSSSAGGARPHSGKRHTILKTPLTIDVKYEEEYVVGGPGAGRLSTPALMEPKAIYGSTSVFELQVTRASVLPYALPVKLYLEEVLIGIHGHTKESIAPPGGSGDPSTAQEARHIEDAERWMRLQYALQLEEATNVCEALFWIAVGLIFKRVSSSAMEDFRLSLAHSWYLLHLDVNESVRHLHPRKRDWLLAAIPVALAQAVYRLMVDAFAAPERALLVKDAPQVIEKLSSMMNYEVIGFQLDARTSKQARRRLFKKYVVDFPYVNQRENAKSMARKELLEGSQTKGSSLKFGVVEAMPLEDLQLEHVLLGRESPQRIKKKASPRPVAAMPTPSLGATGLLHGDDHSEDDVGLPRSALKVAEWAASTLEELSVDRYADLNSKGLDILKEHLAYLNPDALEELLNEEGFPNFLEVASGSNPDAHANPTDGEGASPRTVKTPAVSEIAAGEKTPHSALSRSQSTKTLRAARSRKEAEKEEKRRREELLKKQVEEDTLPQHMMTRNLTTSWVSPCMDRIAPAGRPRNALKKGSLDALRLEMKAPHPIMFLPPILSRSATEPALKDSASSCSEPRGTAQQPAAEGTVESAIAPTAAPTRPAPAAAPPLVPPGPETKMSLDMDPPKRINNTQVIGRFETQRVNFHKKSWDAYKKDYDISTGKKRLKMDPVQLKKEEDAFVKELRSLVGGPHSKGMKLPKFSLNKFSG